MQCFETFFTEWAFSGNDCSLCSKTLLCANSTHSQVCYNTSRSLHSRQVSSFTFAIHSSPHSLMSPWGAHSESFLTSVSIGLRVLPDLHWQAHWGPNESKHVLQIGNVKETLLCKQTARKVKTFVLTEGQRSYSADSGHSCFMDDMFYLVEPKSGQCVATRFVKPVDM